MNINRKKIIFNWKMYGDAEYAALVQNKFLELSNRLENYDCVICPSFTLLHNFKNALSNIYLGAQNCSSEINGAYTGEVSAAMLANSNCHYCIIGHSERKKHFLEKESAILQKMDQLINNNIIPIICIGKFFEDNIYIKNIIANFMGSHHAHELILAYEPTSAIGSGISDSLYSIEDNLRQIKEIIKDKMPNNKKLSLIYGGSVNENNICDILNICDGVLIGKASIEYDLFSGILNKLQK